MNVNDSQELQNLSFDEGMKQLEAVVEQLESGDIPLEKAILLFQQGIQLSKLCGDKLNQVEQKIEMLLEENGSWQKKPFSGEEEG